MPSKESGQVDNATQGYNLMKHKAKYLIFSALVILPGAFFLGFWGLKVSIDFTGGSVFSYTRAEGVWNRAEVQDVLEKAGVEIIAVALEAGDKNFTARTKSIDANANEELKTIILQTAPTAKQIAFETVGPTIGSETARKSFIAFGIACIGIVLYISYAFRNIPKPYSGLRFGVSAILAMIHDALVVLGVFSILGHFKGVEIDSMFITALLTIIGFSVHDTIVVFDRIRENLGKFRTKDFEWVANYSIVETMRRSIATSTTVVITLTALFIFGGVSIKWFVFALLVGVISGTYSSIFNATPILIIWEDFIAKRVKKS